MNNNIKNIASYLFIVLLNILPKAALSDTSTSVFDIASVPDEFKNAIYDVPLAVRIEIDDIFFSDALISLSKTGLVRLLRLENENLFKNSNINDVNNVIEKRLQEGFKIGKCTQKCANIVKLEYDPNTSLLAVYTDGMSYAMQTNSRFEIPAEGSTGLSLQNIFSGTTSDNNHSFSYIGSAATNIGAWTGYSNFNISQYGDLEQTYMLNDMFAQINVDQNQLKLGFFTPDYTLSGGTYGIIPNKSLLSVYGASFGSHQRVGQYSGSSSLIPLTVTANQAGYVEIYKFNNLIGSFPVKAGIQSIPTEGFPDGVYSVDIKLYENGKLVSTSNGEVNKAIGFSGSSLKYKFFAGKKGFISSPSIKTNNTESYVQGGSISYLFHPKFNSGFSLLYDNNEINSAISSTLDISNEVRLYNNLYQSTDGNKGADVQIMFNGNGFYSSLSTNYSSYAYNEYYFITEQNTDSLKEKQETFHSNLTLGGNIGRDQLYTSVGYDHINKSRNISLGLNYNIDEYFPLGSSLTASLNYSEIKDEKIWGGTINLSIPINISPNGLASGSLGIASQKNANGNIDTALTADSYMNFNKGVINNISTNLSASKTNISGVLSSGFSTDMTLGSGYLSVDRSDNGSETNFSKSMGINVNNALIIGAGAMTLTSGDSMGRSNTGVLIDVDTDIDEDSDLVAHVDGVGTIPLTSGTNFIPIQPYKKSTISYDLINGGEKGGATFNPPSEKLTLYPGGIAVKRVNVMRTVTILGRVVDDKNNIMKGVEIRNHAGFSIPESDGIFVLELSIEHPQITVIKEGNALCHIDYSEQIKNRTSTLINAGNLTCTKST